MTKIELIRAISNRIDGATQKDVADVLEILPEVIKDTLKNNRSEKITLPGLGAFSVKHVSEKSGRSAFNDNKKWVKPAHDEFSFKISPSVKELD